MSAFFILFFYGFLGEFKPRFKPQFHMSATINIICYKSKTLANGENPIMVRISKDGKRKYKSLGIEDTSEKHFSTAC